ncbi:hypothetical protein CYG48_20295 (plasmid) [Neorhizobium sp. SOG26]|uniref:flagellar hook-basal body complex protein n=1 Tax=Neorhizobium sp. SOG26 TaxID=2060726 RepID=UPI000E577FFF|nr:flagellar hook-basal body complex protein [Neorhizobium sp. SOG26]AXV18110.1 hypothetical protein CYG48_20295 [Neorhizobium sp. SOG26]
MNSSVSGMKAQSNWLGTTSDNIANASTVGYKRADTAFSTLVMPHQPAGGYSSGGVETTIRRSISEAGSVSYTNSPTDIAIVGKGFFVVEDADGTQYLTRAGNFQKDAQGHLLNSGGYRLAGYDYRDGEGPGGDLVTIDLSNAPLIASASTVGTFNVNLPIEAGSVSSIMVDTPPSENGPSTRYTKHLKMTSTGDGGGLGGTTDIYFTKLAENKWEITAFVTYGPGATGFPYDLDGGDVFMASTVLTFDPNTGEVVDGDPRLMPDPADNFYYDFSSLLEEDTANAGAIKLKGNFISDTPQIDRAAGEVPPSANLASSVFARKDTYSGYAGLPSHVAIDMYSTKVGDNTWEVTFFNQADSTAGGFPYGEPGSAPLATRTLVFDPVTGELISGAGAFHVAIPDIGSWSVDLSDMVSKQDYFSTIADGMSISLDLARSSETIQPHLAGSVASQNQVGAKYTSKSALTAYDTAGRAVIVDIYYSKGPDNKWEVSVFDQRDTLTGGFPYGVAGSPPLATTILTFDPTTNRLTGNGVLEVPIAGGETLKLDMSGSTQLAAEFNVSKATFDGSKASNPTGYSISSEGIVSATYDDGQAVALYRIALADVMSPDNMTAVNGTVYLVNRESGEAVMGFPGSGNLGKLYSGAYENSNVDLADEMTNMIESQRVYTANSKVFQTGSEMWDIVNSLKR